MSSAVVDNVYGHDSDEGEMLRLPGEEAEHLESEGVGEEVGGTTPEPLVADKRMGGRKGSKSNLALYGGVAVVAVLLGAGLIFVRPGMSHHPLSVSPASGAQTALIPPIVPAPLAPSASLANVPLPHLPTSIIHQKYTPQPRSAELTELDGLQVGVRPSPAPDTVEQGGPLPAAPPRAPRTQPDSVVDVRAPSGAVRAIPAQNTSGGLPAAPSARAAHLTARLPTLAPSSPGSPSTAATASPGSTMVAAAPSLRLSSSAGLSPSAPSAALPGVVPAPAATMTPVAGATIATAQAGAMSAAQQTSLYQLVTRLAVVERDDREQQAVLTAEVQQLNQVVTVDLADYDRRLSILEAQTAVSGAMQAGSVAPVAAAIAAAPVVAAPAPAAASPAAAQSAAALPVPAIPLVAQPNIPTVPAQYQVQAASPGLAMLSVVGGGGSIEVQTGDVIPGYGKVLGVVQQGNSWVVKTASGNIQ